MDVLNFFGRGLDWMASYGWNAFVVAVLVIALWVFTGPAKTAELRMLWAGIFTVVSVPFIVLDLVLGSPHPFVMFEPMIVFALFCAVMILKNHTFVTGTVGVMVSIIVAASNPNIGQTLAQALSSVH